MAKIEVGQVASEAEWEAFMVTRPEANFLQSWLWGEFQQRYGREVFRSGFYQDNQLVGVMLSVLEPARRGRYLSVGAGPILDWHNDELAGAMVGEMRRLGLAERCIFVRVRPQLVEDDFSRSKFGSLGFRRAPMHLHAELTSQLDITRSADELRANFRSNTRRELKSAKKRQIVVSSTSDPKSIDDFYQLQLATAKRHGFIPYGHKFLKTQFEVFARAGRALLYSAHSAEGRLIAQAFIIFYGQEAAYHYGASTELARTEPGAYVIQWQAILEAKKRGLSRYNFWGVVHPEQTTHRFYGVSVFKRGFRGEDVQYLPAQDLVLNPARYLPSYLLESYRRKRRKLN